MVLVHFSLRVTNRERAYNCTIVSLFLYVCCARAACLTGVVPVVPKQMVAEFPAIPAANGHRLRERFVSDFRTEQRDETA